MIFQRTALGGVYIVDLDCKVDERGFFARSWCSKEFEGSGLNPRLVQCSVSFNRSKGTLRGIHYQTDPYPETKLVRCTQGVIYDVVVDLRAHSSSFKQWIAVTLSSQNRRAVYVPEGCAHGFLTLEPETEVFYQMSQFYHPELAGGVRWDDDAFGIRWPGAIEVISDRDRSYPDFR